MENNFSSTFNSSDTNLSSLNTVFDSFPERGSTTYRLYVAYKLWYFIIDIILIFPTILGNTLIIVSLIRYKNLRKTKAFILIGNLAVSDLLVGLILIPMDLLLLLRSSVSRHTAFCLWYYCMIYTLITASVLNLFLLSLERFHAIVRPFQHSSRFTAKRIYRIILLTWIFVVTIGLVPIVLPSSGGMSDVEVLTCRNTVLLDNDYQLVMNTIIIAALGTSFAFFIVVMRIALLKSKQKTLKSVESSDSNNGSRHNLRRDIRHTRIMIIVSGIFIICWSPYCVISLIPSNSELIAFIKNWLASLGLINSCLNWIVYGARNKRFRAAFKSILSCTCRKRGEVKITSNSS